MIHFKIATPERIILETDVDSVTLPTELGEITILPNHVPLVSNLAAGEIMYKAGGKQEFFAVSGGVIEVKSAEGGPASGGKDISEVIVLADTAELGHEIDIKRAEEARDAAKKLMEEKTVTGPAAIDAAAQFGKNLARIKVAHRHRTRKAPHVES